MGWQRCTSLFAVHAAIHREGLNLTRCSPGEYYKLSVDEAQAAQYCVCARFVETHGATRDVEAWTTHFGILLEIFEEFPR